MASEAVRVFVDRQLELLTAERAAEVEQTKLLLSNVPFAQLERAGLALGALGVAQVSVGLGGKTLVSLERPAAWHTSTDFPAHGLRTGDLVRIQPSEAKKKAAVAGKERDGTGIEGVIARVLPSRIVVALRGREDADVDLPERCALVKLTNDATFDRMERAMQSVLKAAEAPSDLLRVMLGLAEPSFASRDPSAPPLVFLDERLNASQQAAATFVLREAREVALIHGPPGTGKTQTLVEIIRQLVADGQRVLVCGASNLAVDNLVERLSLHKVPLTRLGHPARVLASVHDATLDSQIQHSSSGAIVKDVKAELEALMGKLSKGKMRGAERRAGWAEVKELRKEFRKRENGVVESVVSQARVVLSTCHGAGSRQIASAKFDVVVIDEAAQALEAVCWIPILKGAKLVLAGDPCQLPPTVKSKREKGKTGGKATVSVDAASTTDDQGQITALKPSSSLEITLFDRLLAMHGNRIKRTLTVQYRMHERIMAFPSREMYDDQLVADDDVRDRLLADLVPDATDDQAEDLIEPLVFFDTAGATFFERSDAEDSLHADSKSNENEATIVVRHVEALLAAGVPPTSITIISGYQAQVALLASYLRPRHPEIEIGTVDAFQGRENDVVIVSLVRSNEKREVGFLTESRRLNVAMTRPRRQLCVVGDSETVSHGTPFLKRWIAHLEEHADLRPVAMLDL